MTLIRLLFSPLILLMSFASMLSAQTLVPNERYLYSLNVDFYGSDLTSLFDTTEDACERACSAQEGCVAFTFNKRSNSCFPKSDLTEQQPYEGAVSARKITTDRAVLSQQEIRRADLHFIIASDIANARRFVQQNADRFYFDGESFDDIIQAMYAAERAEKGGEALKWAGMAAALTDRADVWERYAHIALWLGQSSRGSERRLYYKEALLASINAASRATDDAAFVASLQVMAQALEQNGKGRAMIPALRTALAFGQRDDLQEALDDAIGKYGFRVVGHHVDNEGSAPRICAEFSESLVKVGVDYEPFVQIDGRGFAVQADDAQLCIDGVEHGKRYALALRAGLPSATGEKLNKDVRIRLYVRDRSPSVRFPGRAYVLPRSAQAALPVETVNVDTLNLRLRRVSDRNLVRSIRESYFGRPLSAWADEEFASDIAQEVWTGQGQVQNELNVDMRTRLPMGDVLATQPPGIYTLSASVPGQDPYNAAAAMQWFVLSDLGLSTFSGVDGMQVAVRALGDATAKDGVKVSLISQANAILGETRTDADGFARFPAGLTRGTGAARPALVMAEDDAGDLAFLSLTDPAFDLSDRGVEGNPPAPPIDTFLTTDRGAYRVGETIYATVLTRDRQARALENLPLSAVLRRPDGVEYSRNLSLESAAGGHVFAMRLGDDVPRGAWRVDILSDLDAPPLASQAVLVEDFLPERIDFDLTLPPGGLALSTTPELTIDARYLFGAPGADLSVEGDLRIRSTRTRDGWDGYQFGLYDTRFSTRSKIIGDKETDVSGQATTTLQMPRTSQDPGMPLEADIVVRVFETSGRPVERRLTRSVQPGGTMIGIKPGFEGTLPQRADAPFDIIAVDPTGAAEQMQVRWTVNRVQTRYQWYQLGGRWEWEPTTRRIRVDSGELSLGAGPATISAPTEWGEYELLVERVGTPYLASSVRFYAGWYGGDGDIDTPDNLQMSLNQNTFSPGDPVEVRVVPERAGVALISVMSNQVIERQVVPVRAGENVIPLRVSEDWGTGAYVTAAVLHPMEEDAGQNPARSLGIAHAAVRPAEKELQVSFDVPDSVDGQAGTMRATVQVDGIARGEDAYVTLTAVDVGILNLTGFEAPDATGHYFGQRRLGVEMRDVYGRLIDGLNGAMGTVRSGGDAAASGQVQSPPPSEELMTFFAGPFQVGPDGSVDIDILKPAFNGSIKMMAVAWSPTAVGDASQDVTAADPVVVSASLPRFLAPGDQSRLLLEFVHTAGAPGDMPLSIFADAGLAMAGAPQSISVAPDGTARLNLPITARETGDHLITVVLTTPDGVELRKVLKLGVRDNDAEVSITRQFSLGVGESFTFDANVFAGFRPGTATATLTAGPLARFDMPGLLRQLDRYPYGCTEQLTSGALPLLYVSDVAQEAGLGEPERIQERVDQAIERILARQSSSGSFGLWRVGTVDVWLDAYVTDFLSRARAAGYEVPDLAFSLAMDNLRNRVNYAADFDNGGQALAYALLVLAREGAANMGDLRYYADEKGDNFATPLAAAQLGAALAAYGDTLRADQMFSRAGFLLIRNRDELSWRGDFGSNLRDTAAILRLSAEAGSTVMDAATLASAVKRRTSNSLSTQEAAQVVMAAHALATPDAVPGLRVDGRGAIGPVVKRLNDQRSEASVIENVSQVPMDVTMTAYGVPDVPPPAGGYGYKITRSYYTMDGAPLSGPITSGDRLVTVLEITPFEKVGARLIVDDPLPAGLEIDNPNLIFSGEISGMDWLESAETEHVEFRSERFVAAVDHQSEQPFRLGYVVRAVTPGTYHHPAATMEDMYRPEYRANTDQGRLTVLP